MYEKKEDKERDDEMTLSKDRLKYLPDTGVIKILAVRKVGREDRRPPLPVGRALNARRCASHEEEAKEAGDTVAAFVVGSCSFLRRIAVEEGASKMISY